MDILASTATVLSPEVTSAVHDALSSLLQLVLLLVSTGVAYLVRLLIGQLKSGWKQKLAVRMVRYAEQRCVGNTAKLAYAKSKLKQFFPRLSEEEIDHHIEEAVVLLKSELRSSTPPPK